MLINAKTNWARLETEAPDGVNIVKLVTMQDGIATTFYEHGDILQYHLKFPDAEPLPMVRAFHYLPPPVSVLNIAVGWVCPHTRVPPRGGCGSWKRVHSEQWLYYPTWSKLNHHRQSLAQLPRRLLGSCIPVWHRHPWRATGRQFHPRLALFALHYGVQGRSTANHHGRSWRAHVWHADIRSKLTDAEFRNRPFTHHLC